MRDSLNIRVRHISVHLRPSLRSPLVALGNYSSPPQGLFIPINSLVASESGNRPITICTCKPFRLRISIAAKNSGIHIVGDSS